MILAEKRARNGALIRISDELAFREGSPERERVRQEQANIVEEMMYKRFRREAAVREEIENGDFDDDLQSGGCDW